MEGQVRKERVGEERGGRGLMSERPPPPPLPPPPPSPPPPPPPPPYSGEKITPESSFPHYLPRTELW